MCTVPYQQSSGQDVLHHMTLQIALVWVGCYLIQCTLPPGAHKHQPVMSYLHQMIRCKRLVCVCVCACACACVCVHDRSTGSNIYRHIPTQNTHMHTHTYTYTHTHTRAKTRTCMRARTHTHTLHDTHMYMVHKHIIS